ncbi:MAG: diaminopimelate epimerase [Flavobacteriales bacterium]|jgi:diaminopimelate epimerase|nr:diaminopimelate epimerase [Flavobacteriales bacterium]|tara:strand:- start:35583 stop:36398 length:816 start_codon:yes stop_codon:yes gene_type:complete
MINFFKYNSSGNDFIIIDNREKKIQLKVSEIRKMCDRNFGVGADGLILLESHEKVNYFMNYFNSDGLPSTLCGNGSMCCGHFASILGLLEKIDNHYIGVFNTREGDFDVQVLYNLVTISMPNVSIKHNTQFITVNNEKGIYINTGSPHYLLIKSNLENFNIYKNVIRIKESSVFKEEGVNVTFVEINKENLFIRTYERGVEDETLSCGTGVVAAALLQSIISKDNKDIVKKIKTRGGIFNVDYSFNEKQQLFEDISLSNKVNLVFKGTYHF